MNMRLHCNHCNAPASAWEDGAGYGFGEDSLATLEDVFCSATCLGEWLTHNSHPLVWCIDIEDIEDE